MMKFMVLVLAMSYLSGCEKQQEWEEDPGLRMSVTTILCAKRGGESWSNGLCVRYTANGEEYSPIGEYPATIPVVWDNCHRYMANGDKCYGYDEFCTSTTHSTPSWCPNVD